MTNGSQRIWWHICKTAQAHAKAKFCKRATKPTHKERHEMTTNKHDRKEGRSANSGFAKKRVQWLIEHSTSHQLLWYVDSFELRNPPLRQAPKRQYPIIKQTKWKKDTRN
jgi:hypothetical protein